MTKKLLQRSMLALTLLLCASVTQAQDNPPAPVSAPAPTPMSASAKVNLNFPGVDVHEAAKAILGDILGLNYAVDPSVTGNVTVVTAHPVTKADVFPILEDSLKAAGLGLVRRGAVYTIVPMTEARRQPQLVAADDPGFGTEEITLRFVNATELKKLLDPLGKCHFTGRCRPQYSHGDGFGRRTALHPGACEPVRRQLAARNVSCDVRAPSH